MKRALLALVMLTGLAVSYAVASGSAQIAGTYLGGPGHHPCTSPTTVTSSPSGGASYGGANVVSQDVWNDINISQTLYSCHENSWYVEASAAESGDNGAVQSYPDSNETLSTATPLSSITSMTSNYRAYGTPSCTGNDYEYARDPWWGGPTEWSGPSTEMMIWQYTCNQVPAGTELSGTVSLSGKSYTVWVGNDSAGNIITFESTKNYTSDHTNMLDFADWAQSHGYLPNVYLWQMNDGAEICYTNGTIKLGLQAFNVVINGQPAPTAPREPAAAVRYKAAFNLRINGKPHGDDGAS